MQRSQDRIRTCNFLRVKETRYHCVTRPKQLLFTVLRTVFKNFIQFSSTPTRTRTGTCRSTQALNLMDMPILLWGHSLLLSYSTSIGRYCQPLSQHQGVEPHQESIRPISEFSPLGDSNPAFIIRRRCNAYLEEVFLKLLRRYLNTIDTNEVSLVTSWRP